MHVAIVTGASGGIGFGCATQLAEMGMAVLATGRNEDRLAELARPIDQCLQGEHGFSAARTAEEEGRSISRQATAGD